MPEQINSSAQEIQKAIEFNGYLRASLVQDTPADQRQPFEIGKFLTGSRHLQQTKFEGTPIMDLPETRDLYLDAGRNKVVWEGVFNEVIKTARLAQQNNNPTDLQREVRAYLGIAVALGMDQPNEKDPNLQKAQQIISNLIKNYGLGSEETPAQPAEQVDLSGKGRNRLHKGLSFVGGAFRHLLPKRDHSKQPKPDQAIETSSNEQLQNPKKPIFTEKEWLKIYQEKGWTGERAKEAAKRMANLTPGKLETLVKNQLANWLALDNARVRNKGIDEQSMTEAVQLMKKFREIPGMENMTVTSMATELLATKDYPISNKEFIAESIAARIENFYLKYQSTINQLTELITAETGPNPDAESQAKAIIASIPQITGDKQANFHTYLAEDLYDAYNRSIKPEIEERVLSEEQTKTEQKATTTQGSDIGSSTADRAAIDQAKRDTLFAAAEERRDEIRKGYKAKAEELKIPQPEGDFIAIDGEEYTTLASGEEKYRVPSYLKRDQVIKRLAFMGKFSGNDSRLTFVGTDGRLYIGLDSKKNTAALEAAGYKRDDALPNEINEGNRFISLDMQQKWKIMVIKDILDRLKENLTTRGEESEEGEETRRKNIVNIEKELDDALQPAGLDSIRARETEERIFEELQSKRPDPELIAESQLLDLKQSELLAELFDAYSPELGKAFRIYADTDPNNNFAVREVFRRQYAQALASINENKLGQLYAEYEDINDRANAVAEKFTRLVLADGFTSSGDLDLDHLEKAYSGVNRPGITLIQIQNARASIMNNFYAQLAEKAGLRIIPGENRQPATLDRFEKMTPEELVRQAVERLKGLPPGSRHNDTYKNIRQKATEQIAKAFDDYDDAVGAARLLSEEVSAHLSTDEILEKIPAEEKRQRIAKIIDLLDKTRQSGGEKRKITPDEAAEILELFHTASGEIAEAERKGIFS